MPTKRVLLTTLLVACAYDARYEDCTINCSDDTGCPGDFACSAEGLCRTPGATETCAAVFDTLPSCVGLAKTCGPSGDEDCCATAEPIPGGTFFRSYDLAGDGLYPSTSYPATVSPFVLDRFEVTVGRFRKFVEAGEGTQASPPLNGRGARTLNGMNSQAGWDPSWNAPLAADTPTLVAAVKCDARQTWTDAPGSNEELPINCVTWYEAFAFCTWDGGFLPTEVEWNYAAAGGDKQRAYPWSSPAGATNIDCSYANYKDGATYCVAPSTGSATRVGSSSPKGDGHWEQSDLGGNLWEWMLDWHAIQYENPCNDCAHMMPTTARTVRGGGFVADPTLLRVGHRHGGTLTSRYRDVGLRCARTQGI